MKFDSSMVAVLRAAPVHRQRLEQHELYGAGDDESDDDQLDFTPPPMPRRSCSHKPTPVLSASGFIARRFGRELCRKAVNREIHEPRERISFKTDD
jgi:hypothetical protein